MNVKRYLITVLLVFLTYEILSYLIHSVLLMDAYQNISTLWRSDMMQYLWLMYLADLLFVSFFVLIYTQWSKSYNLISGFIFGLLSGLMISSAGVLNQHVVYPIPFELTIQWMIYGLLQFLISGLVLGLVYKPKRT
ncbi:MAG: hypothetical protein GVY19_02705 [Bacteroidetes bacterium]|jgi:hypothetical protein|nr:hypothetical protein [Bacteroidota bacterium]